MAFKELVCRQFLPLVRILCRTVDRIVTSSKSGGTKVITQRQGDKQIEYQLKSIYAATATLFHISTGLLYTSTAGSAFECLVSSVLLPKPVFEPSVASLPAVQGVKSCISERLSEVCLIQNVLCLAFFVLDCNLTILIQFLVSRWNRTA